VTIDERIKSALSHCLTETHYNWGPKISGKVRDTYDAGDSLMMVTTDRLSAFDRILAAIPFKGEVLTQISAWWFEQTKHIIANHILEIPKANVMRVKKATVFPVEFVMRGYITGSTGTSLWKQYESGIRNYCGYTFSDGLTKNQKLAKPLLTPSTKDVLHDKSVSAQEILEMGLMTEKEWEYASKKAQELYEFGAALALKHGVILVDTKYEMGKDADGNIILIDEVHTPDSSRYWMASTYQEKIANGEEPDNFDKEFLRLWFAKHCKPYEDEVLPAAPEELVITLSKRYIQLYEMITGLTFQFKQYE